MTMESAKSFTWRLWALRFVLFASLQFFALTILAMFLYPGGNFVNKQESGYRFFDNFFSDLGRTVAHNGQSNTASLVLFTVALTLGGLALALFFLTMPPVLRVRRPDSRSSGVQRLAWLISLLAVAPGLIAGFSFVGVAFTPADVRQGSHVNFVQSAFLGFLAAALLLTMAILLGEGYPKGLAAIFVLFTLILGGYTWVLFNVPDLGIQIAGQKVVAYATIVTIFVQAYGALKVAAAAPAIGVR